LKSGIYKIENLINGKCYIGQSENLPIRIRTHINNIKKIKENNKELNIDAGKYGIENFKIEVIEYCDISKLDEKEKEYIKQYDSIEKGYNVLLGGYQGRKYKRENKKIIRVINIEESVWEKLQELAKKENRSASNFIEYLIEKWEKGE
jgi:group I intron endonuclease